jgi:ABC-type glycerol-3-phosphate transport system substrate-binding protein
MLMSPPERIRFLVPTLALAALLAVGLAACSASAANQSPTAVEDIEVTSASGEINGDSVEGADQGPDSYQDPISESTTEKGDVDAEAVSLLSSTTSTHADLGEGCDI